MGMKCPLSRGSVTMGMPKYPLSRGSVTMGMPKYPLSRGSVTMGWVPDWSSVCLEGVYQRMSLSIHIPDLQLLLALGDKDRI